MSSVVISGDTSGAITLAAPAVAGTNTITLPAATGDVMVSGNMPAFSAYASAGTSVATGTWTKINFATERFDTNNNFASSRFTPTVAGYYIVTGGAGFGSFASSQQGFAIVKNGSDFLSQTNSGAYPTSTTTQANTSSVVYFNGSTDYVEIYGLQNSGFTQTTDATSGFSFTGVMVRSG